MRLCNVKDIVGGQSDAISSYVREVALIRRVCSDFTDLQYVAVLTSQHLLLIYHISYSVLQ